MSEIFLVAAVVGGVVALFAAEVFAVRLAVDSVLGSLRSRNETRDTIARWRREDAAAGRQYELEFWAKVSALQMKRSVKR